MTKNETPEAEAMPHDTQGQDEIYALTRGDQSRALAAYDDSRNTFMAWLSSHLTEGVHYGYPPGCRPSSAAPAQWQSRPSLYKSGALLLCDLLRLRPAFDADEAAWRQLGGKPGQFVMRCTLYKRLTGEVVGEGIGAYLVGEKKMGENAALKMAQKRALVAAVINTVPVAADRYTQDLEDGDGRAAPPDALEEAKAALWRHYCLAAAQDGIAKAARPAGAKAVIAAVLGREIETVDDCAILRDAIDKRTVNLETGKTNDGEAAGHSEDEFNVLMEREAARERGTQ